MRIILTTLSLLLASSTGLAAAAPAPAPSTPAAATPSPERLDLARRFVALGSQDDAYMEMVRTGFWTGVGPHLASIEDEARRDAATAEVEALMNKLEPGIRKRLPAVTEAYARAYAAKFSADELRELVAFASTPTGKRYITGITELDTDPGVTEAASALTDDLYPAIMEWQKKACANHAQQRIAMGDKSATCKLSGDGGGDTRSL